jgi:nucleotide-binding universal stress UspA family protein
MYKRILVPLENSSYDATIIEHVRALATGSGASLVLIHVADGWAARNLNTLDLRESEEIRKDREYLDRTCEMLIDAGLPAEALLASGDPAEEITKAAEHEKCDLIAMATHGHKIMADLFYGSVASSVRHRSMVPVLMVRARP